MPALIERNINPARARRPAGRMMSDYRKDVEYLAAHEDALSNQYPNEWVAIFNEEVVAHSRVARDVARQLRLRGLQPNTVVVQFLNREPLTLIL